MQAEPSRWWMWSLGVLKVIERTCTNILRSREPHMDNDPETIKSGSCLSLLIEYRIPHARRLHLFDECIKHKIPPTNSALLAQCSAFSMHCLEKLY